MVSSALLKGEALGSVLVIRILVAESLLILGVLGLQSDSHLNTPKLRAIAIGGSLGGHPQSRLHQDLGLPHHVMSDFSLAGPLKQTYLIGSI